MYRYIYTYVPVCIYIYTYIYIHIYLCVSMYIEREREWEGVYIRIYTYAAMLCHIYTGKMGQCIPATNVAVASLPTETGRSPIGCPSRTRWWRRWLQWCWEEAVLLVPEGQGFRPWPWSYVGSSMGIPNSWMVYRAKIILKWMKTRKSSWQRIGLSENLQESPHI